MTNDPYVYPGTSVLRNRFGIRDVSRLAALENEFSAGRLLELLVRPEPGTYDLEHLARFHRRIFGDVYQWAGEIRTVAIAKGALFALPEHIESYGSEVFVKLRDDKYLISLARDEVAERFAFYFGEINALHPFRDGNGRTQRAFLKQLGRDAGWDVEWRLLSLDDNLQISIDATNGVLDSSIAAFRRIVRTWPSM